VVEGRAARVPHQLQRAAAEVRQGALSHFAPISGEFFFAGRDRNDRVCRGIRKRTEKSDLVH
jgi:hypothetical protein